MRAYRMLLLAALCPGAGAQVVNPDFNAGTAGWSFSLDAGGGGIVEWDAGTGDPSAGSARAGNVFVGAHVDGWRQCVAVSGSDYAFTAAVASALESGNHCRIRLDFIAAADCVDGTPIALEVVLENTRNDGTFETLVSGGPLPEGTRAAALFLSHVRSSAASAGDSFCNFDHVALTPDTVLAAPFE